MKIKSNGKTGAVNFKAFNVVLQETAEGLKVVGAFGASDINSPEDKWSRLNSRYFARALNGEKLVIN